MVMNAAVLLEFQAVITLMCSHRANSSLFSALLVSRDDNTKKDGDLIALDRKRQKKIVMMRNGFSGTVFFPQTAKGEKGREARRASSALSICA